MTEPRGDASTAGELRLREHQYDILMKKIAEGGDPGSLPTVIDKLARRIRTLKQRVEIERKLSAGG